VWSLVKEPRGVLGVPCPALVEKPGRAGLMVGRSENTAESGEDHLLAIKRDQVLAPVAANEGTRLLLLARCGERLGVNNRARRGHGRRVGKDLEHGRRVRPLAGERLLVAGAHLRLARPIRECRHRVGDLRGLEPGRSRHRLHPGHEIDGHPIDLRGRAQCSGEVTPVEGVQRRRKRDGVMGDRRCEPLARRQCAGTTGRWQGARGIGEGAIGTLRQNDLGRADRHRRTRDQSTDEVKLGTGAAMLELAHPTVLHGSRWLLTRTRARSQCDRH